MREVEENTSAEYDSLGIFKEEIYGKLGLKGTDEDDAVLDAVLIDSPDFSPTEYLRRVHGQTSFQNLKNGMVHLRELIAQEEALLKDILKSNFDRFVNAKGTIDNVYENMQKNFYSKPEFGLASINKHAHDISKQFSEFYKPILELQDKEEALKAELYAFKRGRKSSMD